LSNQKNEYGNTLNHSSSPSGQRENLERKFKNAGFFLLNKVGRENIGDYLEFDVRRGISLHYMLCTLKLLKLHNSRLFGFDSFEGMPVIDLIDSGWQSEAFINDTQFSTRILSYKKIDWGRIFLIKGWFADTLSQKVALKYNIQKASFIMVGCDTYSSTKQSLIFCEPLIKEIAVVFFKNWLNENENVKKAFKEFLEENPHLKAVKYDSYEPYGEVFVVARNNTGN